MKSYSVNRRAVLRGAGVALTLPWLPSLLSRDARAQATQPPKRFVAVYLPNGAPEFWRPPQVGADGAWSLSSVLEPLSALKSHVTVLSGLENASAFNANGSSSVEPAHGRQPGGWLTCVDPESVAKRLGVREANGVSVDQIMAAHPNFAGKTPLASLQLGLSTVLSSCDGKQCANSRSVSWRTETEPLYKLVDPKEVFDKLAGAVTPPTGVSADEASARKSVLDAVLESAVGVRPKLSNGDQHRLDEFMQSVRDVEQRIQTLPVVPACVGPARPNFVDVTTDSFHGTAVGYDKGAHAAVMNDLLTWALRCDLSRVVSYMLEDENSEFVYDNVPLRHFTATTSAPSTGVGTNYSSAQHGAVDAYATITWWNVGRVADLCQKLAETSEADGSNLLDHSVIFLGSCMHGSDHSCDRLPALLVGGGGGSLRTNQHVDLFTRPLRDLYFTLMNGVFDMKVANFGANLAGQPLAMISELLKV